MRVHLWVGKLPPRCVHDCCARHCSPHVPAECTSCPVTEQRTGSNISRRLTSRGRWKPAETSTVQRRGRDVTGAELARFIHHPMVGGFVIGSAPGEPARIEAELPRRFLGERSLTRPNTGARRRRRPTARAQLRHSSFQLDSDWTSVEQSPSFPSWRCVRIDE